MGGYLVGFLSLSHLQSPSRTCIWGMGGFGTRGDVVCVLCSCVCVVDRAYLLMLMIMMIPTVSLGQPASAALERLCAQTEAMLDEVAAKSGGGAALVNVREDFLRP